MIVYDAYMTYVCGAIPETETVYKGVTAELVGTVVRHLVLKDAVTHKVLYLMETARIRRFDGQVDWDGFEMCNGEMRRQRVVLRPRSIQ